MRQATLFNTTLPVVPGALAQPLPEWKLEAMHTQLTSVKAAEDGHGVILRLVETAGRPERVTLTPPPGFRQAELCNLMEDAGTPLTAAHGTFAIPLGAWKIVTVRLTR